MFTGIVRDCGSVGECRRIGGHMSLKIATKISKKYLAVGSSVMVNGVCLTVESYDSGIFTVTLVEETLAKSNLCTVEKGRKLNLEPALSVSDALSGHIVTGHVDGIAMIVKTGADLALKLPRGFGKYFPGKASICLNGVSLTVASRNSNVISIALIPETLKKTNLSDLKIGDRVNFEIDILARYLESLLNG